LGPKHEEVRRGWRKLRNEELHNFYSSPDNIGVFKSRLMRHVVYVAHMGEMVSLVGKPGGITPIGRPKGR
jgi:hypothetical protein